MTSLIDWVPDPVVAGMVAGWAARFRTDRAARLGLVPDPDFTSIIRRHLADTTPATQRGDHDAAG